MKEPILQLIFMGILMLSVAGLIVSESPFYETVAAFGILGSGYAIGACSSDSRH
jgi:hypothetical protein